MSKVLDDMHALVARGFLTQDTVHEWYADISYVLVNEALEQFELQLRPPGRSPLAIRYDVVYQNLYADDPSGALNAWWLPEGTEVGVLIRYRMSASKLAEVRAEMGRRGWATGGRFVEGAAQQDQSYSKDGMGVRRNLVGW